MEVAEFHTTIKKIFLQVIGNVPTDICEQKWCQNMLPKKFYQTFIHNKLCNINTKNIICNKVFFNTLIKLIGNNKNEDNYTQCLSILLKYAILIYVNNNKSWKKNPYWFLTWFDAREISHVLMWEKCDNFDRTMFRIIESLKLERLVVSTIISHLITFSLETIPKCKNLIQYWKMLCGRLSCKPIQMIGPSGISEKYAKKIRQIFEHIRISRSVLDEQEGTHSYSAILRGNEQPYRNSEFTFGEETKIGCRNIYIRIKDDSSPYHGLLLFDSKKSKSFTYDYLNSLILLSLAENSEYFFVDSLVFHHYFLLSKNTNIYDPISAVINPLTKEELQFSDYLVLIDSLNELLQWGNLSELDSMKNSISFDQCSENKESYKNSPFIETVQAIGAQDDYERFSTDLAVAVDDVLLYQYQGRGNIEDKFEAISKNTKNKGF